MATNRFHAVTDWFAALDSNDLRVAQSVILVGQLPLVLFINAIGIVIFIGMLSDLHAPGTRVAAIAAMWVLLLPMWLSWRRLRGKPMPATVSRRRILSVVRYSAVLGMAWAAMTVYFLQGESAIVMTLVLAGIGFLCVGATAVLASNPLASIGYSLPQLAAALYVCLTASFSSRLRLLLLLVLLVAGVLWMALRGWAPLRQIVALKAERASLIEDLEHEVVQQRSLIEARALAEVTLARNEARFRALAQLSSDWYWEQDAQHRFIDFSKDRAIAPALHAVKAGKTRWEIGLHDDPQFWEDHRADLEARRTFTDFDYRIDLGAGKHSWLRVSGEPRFDADAVFIGYHGVGKDVTHQKTAETALRESERRLDLAMRATRQGLFDLDLATGAALIDRQYAQMLGYEESTSVDLLVDWYRRLHPADARRVLRTYRRYLADGARDWHVEFRERAGKGDYAWFKLVAAVAQVDEQQRPRRIIGTRLDITREKTAEAAINQLAYFDPLTGLPNRRFMMDRLREIHAACRRTGQQCAMLFLDLDHFKNVNDVRGHAVGDLLLTALAQRLGALLRTEDVAARIGGDEFVVLSVNLGADVALASQAALALAERIRSALIAPVGIDGSHYTIGCSIGITLFPKAGETVDDLLREADTAMYRAKSNGRDQAVFFEATMQLALQQRLSLEFELARAQERDQLALHIQPQRDAGGATVGGELLLRWTHPEHGSVPPSTFIPLAEQSGIILALGRWVLEEACRISVRLAGLGIDIPLSVNVSPKQFQQASFVADFRDTLARTGASPAQLIFEVTEGLLIEDIELTISRMHELALLGLRFSIDDFGTGYSSLAYLRRLPLFEMKIDKSFVDAVPHDHNGVAIVRAMLSMAHHLRLRVVAEGVEHQQQADFLTAEHCDCMQGYLFCRPMPVDDWLAVIQTDAALALSTAIAAVDPG